MQTQNRLLDDLARVAGGAINTVSGLREEIEMRVRERVERLAAEMDFVTREEHEAVRAMAVKAREEQEALQTRLDTLEAELAELRRAGSGAGRSSRAKDGGKSAGGGKASGGSSGTAG